ncbi:hypothetical protein DNK47_03095 [Mycoplasma wenyonii]|uniref:Uncharacterized protein n=1 Tax=Mycoplasma wenyonii TaxID=65123 RepID=A0A328PST2_9MOLU|nr:hypothetical protein [Mycoplasma wenyonii]RAO94800.1 hypothetical protein DNK47_03095 [Mycoplasma wenyonii]
MINKLRALNTLLKDRTLANQKIEEWIGKKFEMLRTGAGGQVEKSFDDLFEIVQTEEKFDSEQRFYCLTFIDSKFIAAETNEINTKHCAYCNNSPCVADRLLLSQKIYMDTKQKHYLKLYIGCEGYASSPRFIPIKPKPEIGIPYGYCLLFFYLEHLLKDIPESIAKGMVLQEELRSCKFFVHSKTKIAKFNRECRPAFNSQKAIEWELYRFNRLKEEEEKAIQMCTFLKQIHW